MAFKNFTYYEYKGIYLNYFLFIVIINIEKHSPCILLYLNAFLAIFKNR